MFGLGKNHSSRRSLQDTCNKYLYMFADVISPFFYDDHRTVIKVCNALVMLFSILDDLDGQLFTRQDDRLDRIGEIVMFKTSTL